MANELTFEQGYICAVAEIVRQHGATTIAADVLRAAGKVDWGKIDKFDLQTLLDAGVYKPNEV